MSELNREEIIKALEWCNQSESCEYCEYNDGSEDICPIRSDALTLIKELAEECKDFEIRALRSENEAATYKDRWETSEKDFKRLADNAAEISRLTEKLIPEVKADTVRKMQERINAHFDSDSDYFRSSHGYIRSVVDQIAKEMLEG